MLGCLLHSDCPLRSLAHWQSPEVTTPQRGSRPSSIKQRKSQGRGTFSKISQRWIWKVVLTGHSTPFPLPPVPGQWFLVGAGGVWQAWTQPTHRGLNCFGCGLRGEKEGMSLPQLPHITPLHSPGSDTQHATLPPARPLQPPEPGSPPSLRLLLGTELPCPLNKCLLRASLPS